MHSKLVKKIPYTVSSLTHSLTSKLQRPVTWEMDIINSNPSLLRLVETVVSDEHRLAQVHHHNTKNNNNKFNVGLSVFITSHIRRFLAPQLRLLFSDL